MQCNASTRQADIYGVQQVHDYSDALLMAHLFTEHLCPHWLAVHPVKIKVQSATNDEIRSCKDGRLVQTWKPACTDLHNLLATVC